MEMMQVVEELRSLVNTGGRVPGFNKRVLVDRERLVALAEELRRSVPANIQEAQTILTQKESIISQANLESQRIKSTVEREAAEIRKAAQQEHWSKIEETEIVRGAQAKAQEIKEQATMEAQQVVQDAQRKAHRMLNEAESSSYSRRDGADQYAREVLFNLEEQLAELLGRVRRGIDTLRTESVEAGKGQEQVAV